MSEESIKAIEEKIIYKKELLNELDNIKLCYEKENSNNIVVDKFSENLKKQIVEMLKDIEVLKTYNYLKQNI